MPLFHNCGEFTAKTDSLEKSACSANMWPLFTDTYHTFFTTNNCKTCHAPGGVSTIPHFANPNTKSAVEVFLKFGTTQAPDVIENKLRSGHQGYSFSNLQAELNGYKKTWNEQVQSSLCSGRATTTYAQSVEFFEPNPMAPDFNIVKDSMVDWQTVVWDMSIINKDLAGVELSVEIKANRNTYKDPENYYVNNIKLKNPSAAIKIKKIYVLLNRKTFFVTTFSGIDGTFPASATFQELNPGSSAGIFVKEAEELYANSDRWAIQVELFEPVK